MTTLALLPVSPHGLNARQQIRAFWESTSRFIIVPSGRRSYKTLVAKKKLIFQAVLNCHDAASAWYVPIDKPNYFCCAPTSDQADRLFWDDLLAMIPRKWIKHTNKSAHFMELIHGPRIYVLGVDAPERLEGIVWAGGIGDEFGNWKEDVWTAHLRPALSSQQFQPFMWFLGVPEGRNHYYKLWMEAIDKPNWARFHWIAEECLPPEEIEEAKASMDENTYAQEYLGSFVNFQGRAYYKFDTKKHCRKVPYNPEKPLIICQDFNNSPGVGTFLQEQEDPDHFKWTGQLGEVYVARNSNTELITGKIIQMWRGHKGRFHMYGDATGGAHKSNSAKSDIEIVEGMMRHAFPGRVDMMYKNYNPFERDRVNAVNSRLENTKGEIRFYIDSDKCPRSIEDFDNVSVNDKGELDKKIAPMLTHLSDATGYYIADRYPIITYNEHGYDNTFWK